jgi:hypothetical protein
VEYFVNRSHLADPGFISTPPDPKGVQFKDVLNISTQGEEAAWLHMHVFSQTCKMRKGARKRRRQNDTLNSEL